MKLLLRLGKLLALLFWGVVLVNLFKPLTNPFHLLVNLVGSLLLLVHLLELVLFNASVKHRAHPWRDRLLILLLGMFHIKSLPAPAADQDNKDADHA